MCVCVQLCPSHLREEHRLKLSENRLLRKILWSKRDEVAEDLEETARWKATLILPLTKYHPGDETRNNEMGSACSTYGGENCTGFWWRPEGSRLLVRPRSRWENNIKIDLKYICWDGVEMIDLALRIGAGGGML